MTRYVGVLLAMGLCAVVAAHEPLDPQVRYDNHKLVEVTLSEPHDQQTMLSVSPLFMSCTLGLGAQPFVVSPERMEALNASGLPYRVLSENVQALIDAERAQIGLRGSSWFESYHTYDQIEAYIDDLVALRPDLASKINIGTSIQGRSIYGIRITAPGGSSDKPGLFFNSCQHAREWVSPAVTMYVADRLVRDYGADPDVTTMVDELVTYVVPISNPDGYVYTWSSDRLWRKNRRNHGNGNYGVDNNRNWGFHWGEAGTEPYTFSDIYPGSGPFSEPETQALRDFMLAHPELIAHIDFHSYSQLILSPWGYAYGDPGGIDGAQFAALNTAMRNAILGVHGVAYTAGPIGSTLYLASGSAVDWAYAVAGVKSWTIELRPASSFPGFELPASQIIPTAEENFAAVLELADYAALTFTLPAGVPTEISPGVAAHIDVNIRGAASPGTERLRWRSGSSGPFASAALDPLGGIAYRATIPAQPCGETIEFYFEAERLGGQLVLHPFDAPARLFSTFVGESDAIFIDNMETNPGWTVSNTSLTDGAWDRGVPVNCNRGDPPTDYDGSGQCWLTDNSSASSCNSDVDGGPTRLTSPLFDLSEPGDYTVRYAAWQYCDDQQTSDALEVHVSNNNGGNWTLVERIEGQGGWSLRSFNLADYVAPSAQVRVRFSITDNPNDSVVEAGVDAFEILLRTCTPPTSCPGDLDQNGVIDLADLATLLANFGSSGGPEDGDLDGDGDVDLADLSALLGGYGTNCP